MTPKQRVEALGLNRPTTFIQRFEHPRKGTCSWCNQAEQPCHLIADVRRDEWQRIGICEECEGFATPFVNGLKKARKPQLPPKKPGPKPGTKQVSVEQVLEICQNPVSAVVIAEQLGLSENGARRQLYKLQTLGLVVRLQGPGHHRSSLWQTIQQEQQGAA